MIPSLICLFSTCNLTNFEFLNGSSTAVQVEEGYSYFKNTSFTNIVSLEDKYCVRYKNPSQAKVKELSFENITEFKSIILLECDNE